MTMTDDVALVDPDGTEMVRVAGAALAAQGSATEAIVWQGRVFEPDGPWSTAAGRPVWSQVSTVVFETPYACPVCRVERTDYEGEPGRYLPQCPSCGSQKPPLPVGLADEVGRWVPVPRDLLAAMRGEIRASTGHWAHGFDQLNQQIVQHDRRGVGGACVTCSLLELLDAYLHPGRGDLVVPDGR